MPKSIPTINAQLTITDILIDAAFTDWKNNTDEWFVHAPTVHDNCVVCDFYADRSAITRKAYFDYTYEGDRLYARLIANAR